MLSDEQVERFNRDGFVLGRHVLDDDRVQELRDEIERVIRDRDAPSTPKPVRIVNLNQDDAAPVWQIVNIWQASTAFERLLCEPAITTAIARLAGTTELRVWHDQVQYKPEARGGALDWHQDSPYWPTLRGGNQVTAWVALDDADEDNGCMRMVPGSHEWGNQIRFLHTVRPMETMPAEWEGHRIDIRLCPVAKGSVHFHHHLTWHGSGANPSGRPRRAIAIHYMTNDTRYGGKSAHPMDPFVDAGEGEPLRGSAFPFVLGRG